jgi:hypothetical protein
VTPRALRTDRFQRVSEALVTLARGCVDCGAELLSARSARCGSCAMAHARANRVPSRRRRPDRAAMRAEAARLPEVLDHYREEWER